MNRLYFGDNLKWLSDRKEFPDASVDLVYLDPPFNSNADYNVLFREPTGQVSQAQFHAFTDTWSWADAADTYHQFIDNCPNVAVVELMEALHSFLKHSPMMAYLAMMAPRLVELHRVLKPSGSIYLHCDPTADHYLRMLLDGVFGARYFRNDIVWKRRVGSFSTVHTSRKFGDCYDDLLFYTKSETSVFNSQYSKEAKGYQEYLESRFNMTDENGRRYQLDNLGNPAPRPNLMYEYKGYKPPANRWAISREKMEQWDKEGRLYFPKDKTKRIRRKRFLDEVKGKPVQTIWDDIAEINSQAQERLGYPTQKPVALLERIISASSNPGVDGLLYYYETERKDIPGRVMEEPLPRSEPVHREKIIVQVKGGGVNRSDVATLLGDVENQKAAGGVLITLEKPSKQMRTEAADAGRFTSKLWHDKDYPRIQILTVEGLLSGSERIDAPPQLNPFAMAAREATGISRRRCCDAPSLT